jgi:hypothetical protein
MFSLLVERNGSLPQVGIQEANTDLTATATLNVRKLRHNRTAHSGQFGQAFKPSQVTFGGSSYLHLQFDGD